MKTICKPCVFAKVENGIQVGCEANRLEIYENIGKASLVENFYEIDTICNMCRHKDIYTDITVSQAREQVKIKPLVIIDYSNQEGNISLAIKSLINQKLKPGLIVVIVGKNHILKTFQDCNELLKNTGIKLLVRQEVFSEDYVKDNDVIIKEVLKEKHKEYMYFTILSPDKTLNENYYNQLDILVNDNCQPTIFYEHDNTVSILTSLANRSQEYCIEKINKKMEEINAKSSDVNNS